MFRQFVLQLIFVTVFFSNEAHACYGSSTVAGAAKNVVFQPPSGTTYYRCNVNGVATCLTACTTSQPQVTSVTFGNYSSCLSYELYYLCFSSSKQTANAAISDIFSCVTDTVGCSSPNTKMASYSTSTSCQAAKPTSVVMCTDGTNYNCHYNQPGCPSGQSLYAAHGTAFTSISSCLAVTPSASKVWIRCYAVASSSVQVYAPDTGTVTITSTVTLPYCTYEACMTGDYRLTSTGTTSWSTQSACIGNLYWAYPCYCPLTPSVENQPYYTMSSVFDHVSPNAATCSCTNGMKLNSIWEFGPSVDNVNAQSSAVTVYPSVSLTHFRCKNSASNLPICRPDYTSLTGNKCPPGETQLMSSINSVNNWATLALCANVRWAALACYIPNSNPSSTPAYYSTTQVFDTDATTTCPGGSVQLPRVNPNYQTGPDKTTAINNVASYYQSYPLAAGKAYPVITHYRCHNSVAPTVVCRPDFTGSDSGPQGRCPTGEKQMTATSPNSWNDLGACMAVVYWAYPCYCPYPPTSESDKAYSLVSAFDHLGSTPGTPSCSSACTNGFQVPGSIWETASAQSGIAGINSQTTASSTYPTSPAMITHYRCNPTSTAYVVCRPIQGGSCPTGETQLTTLVGTANSWTSLTSCNSVRYATLECYNSDNAVITCQSDISGTCTPPATKVLVNVFSSPTDQTTSDGLCTGETTLSWTRCEATSPTVVCRPFGSPAPKGCKATASPPETQLYPATTQAITLGNCKANTPLGNAVYVQCYNSISTTNYLPLLVSSSQLTCQLDNVGCSGSTVVQLPSGVNNVYNDNRCTSPASTNTASITWVLCEATAAPVSTGNPNGRPTTVDNAMLTCRPSTSGCNVWETQRNTVNTFFSNVPQCLLSWVNAANSRDVYCHCRTGAGPSYAYNCGAWALTMNVAPISGTSACCAAAIPFGINVVQVPDSASFYATSSSCANANLKN